MTPRSVAVPQWCPSLQAQCSMPSYSRRPAAHHAVAKDGTVPGGKTLAGSLLLTFLGLSALVHTFGGAPRQSVASQPLGADSLLETGSRHQPGLHKPRPSLRHMLRACPAVHDTSLSGCAGPEFLCIIVQLCDRLMHSKEGLKGKQT